MGFWDVINFPFCLLGLVSGIDPRKNNSMEERERERERKRVSVTVLILLK